jgi:hypothetical protein
MRLSGSRDADVMPVRANLGKIGHTGNGSPIVGNEREDLV